jgi:hypothetical protein
MIGFCLAVAGAVRLAVPSAEFTLDWVHSIEKTHWQEDYRVIATSLVLEQARIKGSGAGMEPPANAQWRDGWWQYHPTLAPQTQLRLTRSHFTTDYSFCWSNRCRTLTDLIGEGADGEVVVVQACDTNAVAK